MEARPKVIRSRRIILPGGLFSGCITIQNGKVVSIEREANDSTFNANEVLDVGNLVVMPGIVDSHVHVNEPGRTHWEGFYTATHAAAAGGITTIVDMPLNSIPPTTTMENFKEKLDSAREKCWIDVGFWGGVIPGNQSELRPMVQAGVRGFKCFLIHSGVDEFPHVTEPEVRTALQQLQDTNAVLLFHAEVELPVAPEQTGNEPVKYDSFLQTRPEPMENHAIDMVIRLCREYRVPCHIVHLSSGSAVASLRQARQSGVPISVETTYHYLTLTAEEIPDGATQFKCCPPIRNITNQDILWQALRSCDIDLVVSDHSPCTVDLKKLDSGDFQSAWGGVSSLQYGLPIFWTAASVRGFSLSDVARVLCQEPARLSRFAEKGKIAIGMDADFVIWDPDAMFKVDQKTTHHKNKITPYHGKTLRGLVHKTILRGRVIYDSGKVVDEPSGIFLLAEAKSAL